MIQVTPTIAIEEGSIQEDFVLSSGPGGQNVNKVNSSVVLRFDMEKSGLPEAVRERLSRLAAKRIASDGILTIKSQVHRTQGKNREDAQERLLELIREAAVAPVVRKATRPTRASKIRTLDAKRQRGETKARRRICPGEN
jgi:ribosome-associated protein